MSETVYGPVTDWATDFDHASPAYAADMHKIWDDLKIQVAPLPTQIVTAAHGCHSRTSWCMKLLTTLLIFLVKVQLLAN